MGQIDATGRSKVMVSEFPEFVIRQAGLLQDGPKGAGRNVGGVPGDVSLAAILVP